MDTQWQGTIDIAVPIERVYAYLADFPKHCEWAQTLERMEQRAPGDARGVGAVYHTYERQAMQADRRPRGPLPAKAFKGTTECEVTELTPPRRIAWRAHPVPVGLGTRARLDFDLTPTDDGGTRVMQTIHMHQAWLPVQLFARLVFHTDPAGMEVKARVQWQASLANIKAILEDAAARPRGGTPGRGESDLNTRIFLRWLVPRRWPRLSPSTKPGRTATGRWRRSWRPRTTAGQCAGPGPGPTPVFRLEGGKFAEQWCVWDTLGMRQQLGVVPARE